MKLDYINLHLENCDCITIDGKYVGDFLVDDIHKTIHRFACNSIDSFDIADTFVIELHKDANKERYQFNNNAYEDFRQMTFDRLSGCPDIASINFILSEDYVPENKIPTKEFHNYYLDWSDNSDNINTYQKSYISDEGHLYIVVSKNKDIFDFFDKDYVNDHEEIDFHFDMCDVGDVYSDPHRYDKMEDTDSIGEPNDV